MSEGTDQAETVAAEVTAVVDKGEAAKDAVTAHAETLLERIEDAGKGLEGKLETVLATVVADIKAEIAAIKAHLGFHPDGAKPS